MAVKTSKKSLPQRKADEIYDMIFAQKLLKPGEKLPNENDFSNKLNISRSTLREAIRILAQQGILVVRRGSGTYVTSDQTFFTDYGISNLSYMRIRLKDLYETRLLIEPQVTALACRRASDAELADISQKSKLVEEAILKGEDRTTQDQDFHKAIFMASHNEFMIQLIPFINKAVSESIAYSDSSTNVEEILAADTLRDHALIIEFLNMRDERAARHAMEIHIHHAINTLKLDFKDEPIL